MTSRRLGIAVMVVLAVLFAGFPVLEKLEQWSASRH